MPSRSVLPAASSTPLPVADADGGVSHYRGIVQVRDPDERAPLPVLTCTARLVAPDAIVRTYIAPFFSAAVAECCRFSLNNVRSRLGQRQADDFELASGRPASARAATVPGIAFQQRAATHVVLALRTLAEVGVVRLLIIHRAVALLEAECSRVPANHVLLAGRSQLCERWRRCRPRRTGLEIAHRDRQRWIGHRSRMPKLRGNFTSGG